MTTLFRNICTIRVFLFIFFLFFTQLYSLSQKKISFEHIGIDEGLISDKIFDIKQDQEGFIWIATYNGLDRYDGNNIVHYVSTPNDSTSLPVSLIKKLIIDEENNVWIITNSSYLVKYNRIYDNFSTISFNDINESERPIIISNVCDGLNNTLWIATLNSGLLKLNTETGTIQKIPIVGYADQPIYMVEKVNESLYLDLGDPSSLLHFNVNTKITTSITLSETPSRKAANFFSKSIYLDSAGVLWVGTIGKGLYRIEGDKTESFSRENGKLSGNIVTSILDYSKDYIWVSTDDGGISVLNKKGGLIQFINKENDNIYSLSANNIENIFKDRQGVIWVSTYGGGISRYDKGRYLFNKTIKPRQKTVNNDVLSFHENDEGDIWIGTDGGGVNKLNKEGLFNRFLYDNDNPNSISGNIITNLEEDNEDQLWMSTFGSGVSIYNKKTKKITRHTTDSGEGLSTNTVWDILKDKEGTIWVALEEGNIARYNTKLKRYEYVRNNSPEKPLLFSRTLFEDSNGVLWCSFINNGLWKIDKKKMIIEKIDLDELNYFSINHIVEDRDNRIWMATERYGLVELLNNDGTISYKKMPLLDNPNDFLFLRAIVEDDEGFLWLSSD
ncbi:MAG: hypothetical protein OEX22_07130, partial [Cyclobacteriaceae bacterium]|nr:hypothetical protein [Cyclobacteriaceae bacterium]